MLKKRQIQKTKSAQLGTRTLLLNDTLNTSSPLSQLSSNSRSNASDSPFPVTILDTTGSPQHNDQLREQAFSAFPVLTDEYGFQANEFYIEINWPHDSTRPQNNNRRGMSYY